MLQKHPENKTYSECMVEGLERPFIDQDINARISSTLGPKYQICLRGFLDDTEMRLKQIEKIIAENGDRKMIFLHAHSINSSSAFMGALNLSDRASDLELKAGKAGVNLEAIYGLYQAMQHSFDKTRQVFLDEG